MNQNQTDQLHRQTRKLFDKLWQQDKYNEYFNVEGDKEVIWDLVWEIVRETEEQNKLAEDIKIGLKQVRQGKTKPL